MTKPIIAILGKSGSGKTEFAKILQKHNIQPVQSHTTRPKRDNNDTSHKFHDDASFDALSDIIAYTEYGGYKYGGTLPEGHPAYSYVIDERGLKMLREDPRFDVKSVLILAPDEIRKERTDEKRFNRDKDVEYTCLFDDIILNHRGLGYLEFQANQLIEKWIQ